MNGYNWKDCSCLFGLDILFSIGERSANISLNPFEAGPLILIGVLGFFLGLIFLLIFIYRRLKFFVRRLSRKPVASPRTMRSLRNLLLIFLWTAVFGLLFFAGFFFQAYYTFTKEVPVAKVTIIPLPQKQKNLITLELYLPKEDRETRQFEVSGDQWMIEGDILKWKNWINFLGLHTRYRLTRLRGRYIQTSDELMKPASVYSLVEIEDHPIWGYLYRYGPSLPFVSTVYGNAVFQSSEVPGTFLVYVSTSGFLTRRVDENLL